MSWLRRARGWPSPSQQHAWAGAALVVVFLVAALLAQRAGVIPPTRFAGGVLEASGVVAVPQSAGALIVDDGREDGVLWMRYDASGVGSAPRVVPLGARVEDPEDITTDGEFFYVVGSQSRGARRADDLVRFRFDAPTERVSDVERVNGLDALLDDRVTDLRRLSRGAGGALNIEGLVWDSRNGRLLLGLRSPQVNGQALLIAVRLTDMSRPLTAGNLSVERDLIRLDLGGLAVRGLGYDAQTSRVLIIAGGHTIEPAGTFRLFEWDGAPASKPVERARLRGVEKPEGVTRAVVGGRMRTLVVFDLGGYQWLD